ncbi:MAG TPA: hypothetical protein VF607_01995 [Verrucomicrobiae bacterium]
MKLFSRESDQYGVEFADGEKALFLHVLAHYPLVPPNYHQLSRDPQFPHREENQHLLDEALAAQREENQQAVLALLSDARRFTDGEETSRVHFSRADLEWLLQVVNDVRIGAWIALGSPGYDAKREPPKDRDSLRYLMFMEVAGAFEMFFLGVINGDVTVAEPEP